MNNAHWIKNTHLFEKDDYECSACGCKVARPTDRCPGCGAEMSGQRSGHDWTEDAAFLDIITGRIRAWKRTPLHTWITKKKP